MKINELLAKRQKLKPHHSDDPRPLHYDFIQDLKDLKAE
jgi:hypothetical protein